MSPKLIIFWYTSTKINHNRNQRSSMKSINPLTRELPYLVWVCRSQVLLDSLQSPIPKILRNLSENQLFWNEMRAFRVEMCIFHAFRARMRAFHWNQFLSFSLVTKLKIFLSKDQILVVELFFCSFLSAIYCLKLISSDIKEKEWIWLELWRFLHGAVNTA